MEGGSQPWSLASTSGFYLYSYSYLKLTRDLSNLNISFFLCFWDRMLPCFPDQSQDPRLKLFSCLTLQDSLGHRVTKLHLMSTYLVLHPMPGTLYALCSLALWGKVRLLTEERLILRGDTAPPKGYSLPRSEPVFDIILPPEKMCFELGSHVSLSIPGWP